MDGLVWLTLISISKMLMYMATASYIGGCSIAMLSNYQYTLTSKVYRYITLMLCLGIFGVFLSFFAQVAALSESGLSGMVDQDMMAFLWQSGLRYSLLFKLVGFIIGLIMVRLIGSMFRSNSIKIKSSAIVIYLANCILLIYSYVYVGHINELTLTFQVLLLFHVFVAMWWMGSLWPLYSCCQALEWQQLAHVMRQFGRYASILVVILIVAGSGILYQFIWPISEFANSGYGQFFIAKLVLVGLILLLAATHKFILVPRLSAKPASAKRLKKSIKWEMLIGLSILIITTILTTLVGPGH